MQIRRINAEAEVDRDFFLSDHRCRNHQRGPLAVMHDRTSTPTPPPPTVQRADSAVPQQLAPLSFARRFRGDRPAPAAEIPLRLYFRRRRDRRRAPRQSPRVRRIRLRAAGAERRLRPRPDHDPVRQDLRGAVRHSADGLGRAVRLSRRHRAGAGGGGDERADVPVRLVADHARRRPARESGGLVPGLSGRATPRASSRWSTGSRRPATTPSSSPPTCRCRPTARTISATVSRSRSRSRRRSPGIRSPIRTGCSASGRAR